MSSSHYIFSLINLNDYFQANENNDKIYQTSFENKKINLESNWRLFE